MYSPSRNPTELYYTNRHERDALLREKARNKRLVRRPLAKLSTILVVLAAFVGLASIAVGPGRAIDYIGTHLTPVVGILGVLAVTVSLLGYLVTFRECGGQGLVTSLRRRGSIRP